MKLTGLEKRRISDNILEEVFSEPEQELQDQINTLVNRVFTAISNFYDRDLAVGTTDELIIHFGNRELVGIYEGGIQLPEWLIDSNHNGVHIEDIKENSHFMLDNAFHDDGGYEGLLVALNHLYDSIGWLNEDRMNLLNKVMLMLAPIDTLDQLKQLFKTTWPRGSRFIPEEWNTTTLYLFSDNQIKNTTAVRDEIITLAASYDMR